MNPAFREYGISAPGVFLGKFVSEHPWPTRFVIFAMVFGAIVASRYIDSDKNVTTATQGSNSTNPQSAENTGTGGGGDLSNEAGKTEGLDFASTPPIRSNASGCRRWVDGQSVLAGYEGEQTGAKCIGDNRWWVPRPGGGLEPIIVAGP